MPRERSEGLTPREADCLLWAARGFDIEQTAKRLGVSPETVKDHRRRAMLRMGAVSITHCVVVALKRGDIELGAI